MTFNADYSEDLQDPESAAYADMTAKAQEALNAASTSVGTPVQATFEFSEGM